MKTTPHITTTTSSVALLLFAAAASLPAAASPAAVAADQQQSPDMRWTIDTIYLELLVDEDVVSRDDAFSAADAAAATWNDTASGPQLVIVSASDGVAGDRTRLDRHNVIHFTTTDWQGDPRAAAETIRMGMSGSGVISEVDVDVNAARFSFCRCERDGALDLQSILTHELGHVLGLRDDFAHEDATMFIASTEANLTKRTLSSYDVVALSELYRGVTLRSEGGCSSTGASVPCVALMALLPLLLASQQRRRRPGARARTRASRATVTGARATALPLVLSAVGCALPVAVPVDVVVPVGVVDIDGARGAFEASACDGAGAADETIDGGVTACAALLALDRSDDGALSAPPALPARLPAAVEIDARSFEVAPLLARDALLQAPALTVDPGAVADLGLETLGLDGAGGDDDDVAILDASLSFDTDSLTVDLPALAVFAGGARVGVFAPHEGGSSEASPLSLAEGGAAALLRAVWAGASITLSPESPTLGLQTDGGDGSALSRPGGKAAIALALTLAVSTERELHANVTFE